MTPNLRTKAEVLTALDEAYSQLGAILDTLDESHAASPQAVGSWSVINVLQHLNGWLVEMLGAAQRLSRGERPIPDDVDYSNFDAWNAKFIELGGLQTLTQARDAFQHSHAAFRSALAIVPDDRYGDGRTVNRIAYMVCIEHYQEHAQQISAYLNPDQD